MVNCNIIIPTYNRPDYLKRILSYYNKYGKDFNIIVADSSSNKKDRELNGKIISSFSNFDILYLNDFSSTIEMFSKIKRTLNYVKEKYCVICAEDDFITPNGIKQSVDFLKKNPDFTVVQGHYIRFHLKYNKKGQKKFCWLPAYPYKSITSTDPGKRLLFHFSHYDCPTFYAVHRTNFLKMIFKEDIKFTEDCRFGELLPSMLSLIYGKMMHLDVLFGARNEDSLADVHSTDLNYTNDIKEFIKKDMYDNKYSLFRECLSRHLSKNSKLSIEESKKVVDNTMSSYMKKYYNNKICKTKEFLDYIRLPDFIYSFVRGIHKKIIFLKDLQKKKHAPWCFIDKPSSKYYDDFEKMQNHVLLQSNEVENE